MILTTRAFHALLGLVLGLVPAHPPQAIRCVESSAGTGSSAAVLVDDAPLVHTAQLLPVDDAGAIVAPADGRAQFDQLMAKLRSTLRASASDLDRLVKLNVYATSDDLAELARRELAGRFTGEHRPAVGFVVTRLPDPAALLALDAVAVSDAVPPPGVVPRTRAAAVLPPGARLYISGQAEPGELPDATRKTLASLSATLRHYGLDDRHAVALKCFVYPMESVAEVQQEIARHFGEAGAPPVSFVAWRSALPIEIELVAWAGAARPDAEAIEFLTPPGFKASPLFSRVTRINHGGSIFFSGFFADPNATAEAQVKATFDTLKRLLARTGSDLKHLAKATYYVTDEEVSRVHNELRPKYYDPERPPAASKAMVAGSGRAGCRYTMDMVAVAIDHKP